MRQTGDVEEVLPARFGPFVLLRMLGAGGMGRAYLARHRDWPGRLVVKRMHTHLLDDAGLLKRFEHEARVATYVRNPNVAALVAMGTVEGEPFFATEHVLGLPISAIIERVEAGLVREVPIDIALQMGLGVIKGVEAIHEAVNADTGARLDLVHRDLGARNILVGTDGIPRIIDLGLGKSILSDWQTATNMVAGSPDYMPPEQAMGKGVDRRADVYASAVTIWELLAGRKRIKEVSIPQRITRAIEAQPEPLLPYRPEASPRLEALLQKAMEPQVHMRTPTATMLRAQLEREIDAMGKLGDVAAWLETACATALAKEKRLLEEAEENDPWRGHTEGDHTQILVAHRLFVPSSSSATGAGARMSSGEAPTHSRAETLPRDTQVVPSLAGAPALKRDLSLFGRKVTEQTMLGLMGAGTLVLIALVLILWSGRRVDVEPMPVPSATGPFAGLPSPPASPVASPTAEPSVEPTEDVLVDDPEPTPIPPSVITAKRLLVERIRSLRKVSYAGDYQRKLTALSAKASRARTDQEIRDLTQQVIQLEQN